MKLILSIPILFWGLNSASQINPPTISGDLNVLIEQTKYIMGQLGIRIRPNIGKDDSLVFHIMNSYRPFQRFKYKYSIIIGGNDTALRIYQNPFIELNRIDYAILTKRKDTSKIVYVETVAIICHEVTHYLQTTIDVDYHFPTDSIETWKYHHQQGEREGNYVLAYYFLNYINPDKLKGIMEMKIENSRKGELLVNAYMKIAHPKDNLYFPEVE